MNGDIFAFMESHGISLKDSGSAERGFTQAEVLDLLRILGGKNMKPIGLEVWHRRADGRFNMDSLAGWVSVSSSDSETLFVEVKEVIMAESEKKSSIFTLQF